MAGDRGRENQVMIEVNSLGILLYYPHDRGIGEYVNSLNRARRILAYSTG